nr:hypothetical protein [Paenibacillus farraposensis]
MKKGLILEIVMVVIITLSWNIWRLGHEQKPNVVPVTKVTQVSAEAGKEIIRLVFPSDKYPETAQHIKEAIAAGKSPACTIDREGAEHNRELSLKDVPTRKGKAPDEWPMAMCAEGGVGADIKYISPKDSRGAESWVSDQLYVFKDGTRIEFVVK